MSVTALAPWFGSARLIAEHVGKALDGCEWVGIPFAGGCCEVLAMKARTIVVNDLHRHLVNLARVVSVPELKTPLVEQLEMTLLHPTELAECQQTCRKYEKWVSQPTESSMVDWAAAYFVCCWMTRSGCAGTPGEFTGKLCLRWEAGGGDSNVRFRSAIESLETFHKAMTGRCTFSTLDVFDFLDQCKDRKGHGIYADPPFFGPGEKYSHNPGKGDAAEQWHRKLADRLHWFADTRVVVRAYDVPLVREIYPVDAGWEFREFTGRKQTNGAAPELLIVRN